MEVDQLKEKLEEVSLDLQIMKEEVQQVGTEGGATSYQVKQLEQQNERLKEALVKYVLCFCHRKCPKGVVVFVHPPECSPEKCDSHSLDLAAKTAQLSQGEAILPSVHFKSNIH